MDDALEGFVYYLRVERGRSDNTVEAYRRDLLRFISWLAGRGIVRPEDVDASDLADYLVYLHGEGLGARSVARARSSVRQLFKFLVQEHRLEGDPTIVVPETPPSLAKHEREYVEYVLAATGGNISEAARRLGLHRQSLQRKLRKYPPRR